MSAALLAVGVLLGWAGSRARERHLATEAYLEHVRALNARAKKRAAEIEARLDAANDVLASLAADALDPERDR